MRDECRDNANGCAKISDCNRPPIIGVDGPNEASPGSNDETAGKEGEAMLWATEMADRRVIFIFMPDDEDDEEASIPPASGGTDDDNDADDADVDNVGE